MIRAAVLFAALVVPTTATAQFVPTMDRQNSTCPERPSQPRWMDSADVREAHKIILVQQMYRAQSMTAVVDSGECSCETRYPSWARASEYFFQHYAALSRHEILDRTSDYSRTANELRLQAQAICENQVN